MDENELLALFGLVPVAAELPEIRRRIKLLIADKERTGNQALKTLSIQLFAAGKPSDALLIYKAKMSSFDAGCYIDIELTCGAGLERTKRFPEKSCDPDAKCLLSNDTFEHSFESHAAFFIFVHDHPVGKFMRTYVNLNNSRLHWHRHCVKTPAYAEFTEGRSMKHIAIALSLLLTPLCFEAQAADRYPAAPVRISNSIEPPGLLEKLLDELRQAAKKKDLSKVLANVGKTFFWAGDHGGGFKPAASAKVNFATALNLDPNKIKPEFRAEQWLAFRSLLDVGTASGLLDKSGIICLPGKAKLVNEAAATKVAEKFDTDPWFGMLLAAGAPVAVRKAPSSSSNIVGTVKNEAFFIRLKLRTDPDATWEPVHLSTGVEGWIAKGQVGTFLDPQLCFGKAGTGAWQIVGFNGGGD